MISTKDRVMKFNKYATGEQLGQNVIIRHIIADLTQLNAVLAENKEGII